jgi:hypothetical protein
MSEPAADDDFMLTTIDNPWDPFTQYQEWYAFDLEKGYNTPGFLARICKTSSELSEEDQDLLIKEAINEIVRLNVRGIDKKATRRAA